MSYSCFKSSIKSNICLEDRSSDGFGGIGPAVKIDRFSTPLSRITLFASISFARLVNRVVKPLLLDTLKVECKVGRRKSASIKIVFLPACAMVMDTLALTVDLPALAMAEVKAIVFTSLSTFMKLMLVRMFLNCSEITLCGLAKVISLAPFFIVSLSKCFFLPNAILTS